MLTPCEYCGKEVKYPDLFFRLGIWPCCKSCQWVPLAALVFFGAYIGFCFIVAMIAWFS